MTYNIDCNLEIEMINFHKTFLAIVILYTIFAFSITFLLVAAFLLINCGVLVFAYSQIRAIVQNLSGYNVDYSNDSKKPSALILALTKYYSIFTTKLEIPIRIIIMLLAIYDIISDIIYQIKGPWSSNPLQNSQLAFIILPFCINFLSNLILINENRCLKNSKKMVLFLSILITCGITIENNHLILLVAGFYKTLYGAIPQLIIQGINNNNLNDCNSFNIYYFSIS